MYTHAHTPNPRSSTPTDLLKSDTSDRSVSGPTWPRVPGRTDVQAPPSAPTSVIVTNSLTPQPPPLPPPAPDCFLPSPRLISTPHRGSPKAPSHPHCNLGLPQPSLPIKHKAWEESLGLEPISYQDLETLLNRFPRTTLPCDHCSQGRE